MKPCKRGHANTCAPPLVQPLKEAFERLSAVRGAQVSTQQKKLGKIVGFLSAKGGCGATTFASHVATSAAKQSDRAVLLADLDFEAGLLRFILKAKCRYSLRDALDNMHRMDSNYWHALVSKHGDRLEFIAAPEELIERTAIDPRNLSRLLRFLRSMYALTIVDFGRWYSSAALESMAEMETLYLIIRQETAGLENARDFIELAGERGKGPDRIKVLVNCVSSRTKPDLAYIEDCVGIRPAGVFSDDAEALYETWSEGRLLDGSSDLGRQLADLAKSIVVPEAKEPEHRNMQPAESPAASGISRFLSFMRSTRGNSSNTASGSTSVGAAMELRAMAQRCRG